MKLIYALSLLLIAAAPAVAQNEDLGAAPPPGGEVETVQTESSEAEEGGLTFTVTDESALDDLSLAIPAFAAERDVATAANSQGTAALGAGDLRRREPQRRPDLVHVQLPVHLGAQAASLGTRGYRPMRQTNARNEL